MASGYGLTGGTFLLYLEAQKLHGPGVDNHDFSALKVHELI